MKKTLTNFTNRLNVHRLGDVTWSHAVNSKEKLSRFLNKKSVMIIESDIRISQAGIPVCAHPPETESDLSYDDLILAMSTSSQGLKLDFKDPEILKYCLRRMGEVNLPQPVLLNADILQGNGANPSKFTAADFIENCSKLYPEGILSAGWTTTANPELPYTKNNVDEMLSLVERIDQVTFPVRACLLPNSWGNLQHLLKKDNYSLTVWNNEPVSHKLIEWIKENTDPDKTFYDFIDDHKEPLRLI